VGIRHADHVAPLYPLNVGTKCRPAAAALSVWVHLDCDRGNVVDQSLFINDVLNNLNVCNVCVVYLHKIRTSC
jgi:hypothetical protein